MSKKDFMKDFIKRLPGCGKCFSESITQAHEEKKPLDKQNTATITESVKLEVRDIEFEKAFPNVLNRIQSLLAVSMQFDKNPKDNTVAIRLNEYVKEFVWLLQEIGLNVLFSADDRQDAFTPITDDPDRTKSEVIVPAILRDETTILKGMLCVPKEDNKCQEKEKVVFNGIESESLKSNN